MEREKNILKICFLVVSDNFSQTNDSDNLVRGLFLSLNIRPYATCGLLGIFLGSYGGAQIASK
jgi:hypothetical protein